MAKWNASSSLGKENPIEALSRFLQQEEVQEEHERQERQHEILEKGFRAWRMACSGQASPGSPRGPQLPSSFVLEDLILDEEVVVSDLDYESCEGDTMAELESEVLKRVNTIITNALEIAQE